MRNLKRALSLALASVMLLGMMVVGSSAAGYPDVSEEENIEAIEVLQSVGVMEGDNNGNFNPDDYVTREQMAVIMSKLLNLDYNYYQGTNPFSDVPSWAAPYVAACAANGITSGIGGGMYGAGQNVNAVQAALMMLKALGYFQYQADFGDSYILATVKQATEVGLFDYIDSNAQSSLSRNEVAQMALNALKSDMVTFTGDVGIELPNVGNVGYKSEYTPRTSTLAKYHAIEGRTSDVVGGDNINRGQYYVQLGEELYNGELKLTKDDDDIFMRPSRHWEYKGQAIGTYMKKENIRETYTAGVKCRTLYDLIGRNNLNDYEFTYYVDGVEQTDVSSFYNEDGILSRQDRNFGATSNGVLTQVFVDIEAETIDITSIHTWLGKATVDYNKNTEKVTLEIYTACPKDLAGNLTTTKTPKPVSKVDVPEVENVKLDDYVLVTMSGKNKGSINVSDLEVVSIDDVEILSNSTLTKFSNRSDDPDSNQQAKEALFSAVTTGGTEYKSSSQAFYSDDVLELYDNQKLTDKTYNVYLDNYGYAIGVDLYSGGDNYVFISGVMLNDSTITSTYADANAIFLDGTMKTIRVNVKDTNKSIKSVLDNSTLGGRKYFSQWGADPYDNPLAFATMNRWFTYTVNADGVYTLTPAARMFTTQLTTAKTIKCNNVVLDRTDADTQDSTDNNSAHPVILTDGAVRAYGNDDSIYIIPEVDNVSNPGVTNKVISGVEGVYTGVQDVEIAVDTHTANNKITTSDGDATELYDSVYTVYDKNNYIIASVVLGEARGTSANYAYILSHAKSEELIDGTYYWEFDAVVNGTKTTLTAQSKFKSTMNELRAGHVQELRYTGDYVTSIKNVTVVADPSKDKIYTDVTNPIDEKVQEIYDIGHVHYTNDGNRDNDYECGVTDCTLVEHTNTGEERLNHNSATDKFKAPNLHLDGRTLYLGAEKDWGLTFVDVNVPTVVIQPVDGVVKSVQYGSVPEALAALGDADDDSTNDLKTKLGFDGRLVAVLDKTGRAQWIVIISDTDVETVGADKTGIPVDIKIERYVKENDGEIMFSESIVKKNTKSFDYTVGSVSGWNIDIEEGSPAYDASTDAPAGYHLVGGIDTVRVNYIKGQTVYTAKFTYVKDTAVPYTVNYSLDGGTGTGTGGATEASVGAGVALPTSMTKTNYVFVGWASTAEKAAAGTADAASATDARFRPTADCTLYAVWRLPKVSFVANDGAGDTVVIDVAAAGGTVTAPAGTGFTRAGYTFSKWNTADDGSGTDVNAGAATAAITADATYYAVWTENTVGGTVTKAVDSVVAFTITGNTFTGKKGGEQITFTITMDGGGSFADGAVTVTNNKGLTLTGAPATSGTNTTLNFTLTLPAQADITSTMADLTITVSVAA